MLMDDWPYDDQPEPAVLQATISTMHLRNGHLHATCTMAAEESESGSFTAGAAEAEASVGIRRRSSAV